MVHQFDIKNCSESNIFPDAQLLTLQLRNEEKAANKKLEPAFVVVET